MLLYNSLILLRGLPGSGKTSLARLLSEDNRYPTYSVDDYFTHAETGAYHFDFKHNHYAYKQCEALTKEAMKENKLKILVHNTFTMGWEMEPYFKLAAEFNYRMFVVTVENYHGSGNSHEVSPEQLQKMAEKYKVKLL